MTPDERLDEIRKQNQWRKEIDVGLGGQPGKAARDIDYLLKEVERLTLIQARLTAAEKEMSRLEQSAQRLLRDANNDLMRFKELKSRLDAAEAVCNAAVVYSEALRLARYNPEAFPKVLANCKLLAKANAWQAAAGAEKQQKGRNETHQ